MFCVEQHPVWNCWQMSSRIISRREDEIVNLSSDSVWYVELDQRYVKSWMDALANHCKSMDTRGSKKHERSRIVSDLTHKLNPQEHREFRPLRRKACRHEVTLKTREQMKCKHKDEIRMLYVIFSFW